MKAIKYDITRIKGGHRYYEPGHMYYDSKTQWSVIYNLSNCSASISIGSDFGRCFKVRL